MCAVHVPTMSTTEAICRGMFYTLMPDWNDYAASCPFSELRRKAWHLASEKSNTSAEVKALATDWLDLSFQVEGK